MNNLPVHVFNYYQNLAPVVYKYYIRILPTLFWNLVGYNLICTTPLINHGLMREKLFKSRGSYNPATYQLPFASALFLINWQIQKQIWNPINRPWFCEFIARHPEYCVKNINRNINFVSLSLISLTGSFVLANIYQLMYQDIEMKRYLHKSNKPFILSV